MRADLDAGPLLYEELFAVHPYDFPLLRLRLSGRALSELLAGLRTDGSDPDAYLAGPAEIDPSPAYTVAANEWMAGGDGFPALRDAQRVGSPVGSETEALTGYVARPTLTAAFRRRGPRVREASMELTPAVNRIAIAAVLCLIAAFAVTALVSVAPAASGGDVNAVRDDQDTPIAAVADDDDDDDSDDTGTRRSRSGSRSIGSRSANTGTGTTRGTGPSKTVSNSGDRSRNTATGTTRGTGPSRSVSNSS